MFRGRSAHVLDPKGRISIPARFRDVLVTRYDGRLMVTNQPMCLVAYPIDEWRVIEEQFSQHRLADPQVVSFLRYFMAAAQECQMDRQGRILIPAPLREEAGLTKECVFSGMLTHFEIWSKQRLDEELARAREKFDQYISVVAHMGGRS